MDASKASSATASPQFRHRGVVLYPDDLSWHDWPERAARAKLTTIALHDGSSPQKLIEFIGSTAGRKFLSKCQSLHLEVEYEFHAMRELLPRERFNRDPSMYRMNVAGTRTPDANLCVHSRGALEIVGESAQRISQSLRPTTGRYFLWGDDGAEWCRCAKCAELSDSDQALLLANHLQYALHEIDHRASTAYLAYANTVAPPTKVKPVPHVFLEFAPIHRDYDVPYADQKSGKDGLDRLDANLAVFPAATAQALEYWLDMSRFSGWRRPVPALPWHGDVFRNDLRAYATRGIRSVTSFAAWIDAEYVSLHGDPTFIDEYGAGLLAAGTSIR